MSAFLNEVRRKEFLELFPTYSPRFSRYLEFVNNILFAVAQKSRRQLMHMNVMPEQKKNGMTQATKTKIAIVAQAILDKMIENEKKLKINEESFFHVLKTYIYQQEHAGLYLHALGICDS